MSDGGFVSIHRPICWGKPLMFGRCGARANSAFEGDGSWSNSAGQAKLAKLRWICGRFLTFWRKKGLAKGMILDVAWENLRSPTQPNTFCFTKTTDCGKTCEKQVPSDLGLGPGSRTSMTCLGHSCRMQNGWSCQDSWACYLGPGRSMKMICRKGHLPWVSTVLFREKATCCQVCTQYVRRSSMLRILEAKDRQECRLKQRFETFH